MPVPFHQTTRALQADRHRWVWLGLPLGLAVLAAWAAWATLAEVPLYAPAGVARVELDRLAVPVQVEQAGRLIESHLRLDQPVEEGAVLARLDDPALRLALDEARARRATLETQRETRRAARSAQHAGAAPAAEGDAAAVGEARARLEAARAAEVLAREELEATRALHARAVASRAEVNRQRAAVRRARAAVDEARQTITRLDAEQRRRAAERLGQQAATDAELARIDEQIAAADAELARLEHATAALTLRAPVGGRIGAVEPRGIGAHLPAGAVLATLVGDGALRITARLPAGPALGRVRAGQRARLRLDGFAWTRYGVVEATVSGVAADGLDGGLRVELEPTGRGHDVPLQHGLTGRVEIEVERIAPVEVLLGALDGAAPAQSSPTERPTAAAEAR